jgi:EAL domain-containing protein (putative c-di-GMP-specific phosphodiesterase class I)
LGENLGIEVVAEGIETEYQLELLRSLGCRLGQGYIFSQPVDADSAILLLLEPFVMPAADLSLRNSISIMETQEIH